MNTGVRKSHARPPTWQLASLDFLNDSLAGSLCEDAVLPDPQTDRHHNINIRRAQLQQLQHR